MVFALAFRTGKTSRDVNPSMRGYKSSMSLPMWNAEWSRSAACRDTDPDLLFVQGAAQNRVKVICAGCSVRTECLADALDNEIEFGVWGGMTERERRALLRRRSNVTSWRELLMNARKDYDRLDPVAFVRGA